MKQVLPVFLGFLLFLCGCVSSPGNEVNSSIRFEITTGNSPSPAPVSDLYEYNPVAEGASLTLTIDPTPADALVSVRGVYSGIGKTVLNNLAPGYYPVTLTRSGYRDKTVRLEIREGQNLTAFLEMEQETGILAVDLPDSDALVLVDGEEVLPLAELTAGFHELRVRLFGYRDYLTTIVILPDTTTRVPVVFEPAPFEASGISMNRRVLNPHNPGALGITRGSFSITAEGTAEVEIFNSRGRQVAAYSLPPFTTWRQEFFWDGRDEEDQALPEDEYRVLVTLKDASGTLYARETGISIDYSALLQYRELQSGVPGLLFCPLPGALPPGSLQLSTTTGLQRTGSKSLLPMLLSFRVSPAKNWEVFQTAEIAFSDQNYPEYFLSGGVVRNGFDPQWPRAFHTGFRYRFSRQSSLTSLRSEPNGFFAGVSGGFRTPPWGIYLSPELVLDSSLWTEGAGSVDLYGRLSGGILLDYGYWALGLSAVLDSLPYFSGIALPVHTGLEGRLLLPGTEMYISLLWQAGWGGESFPWSAGIGFGVLH